MNKKTTAFLNALVNLCVSHGVKLSGSDQYDGDEKFIGTSYEFDGNGISLPVKEAAEALESARRDHREPNLVYIFRDSERLGRRWLHGKSQWRKSSDKVQMRSLTLPEARRMIRELKKRPGGAGYAYGVSSIFGRDHVVVH